ncbi:flagellar hook-basal body protein [Enterococcus saccharolyticus]|uniref:flagellar hook-basal body protein n=1 Tax=Enterococcus saccharolyticus TaxID=41997 RepID=UPI001E3BAA91|nr:flagellar hook-basal body protein [Enterococcus saccharolyticus]MCD5002868.1 flagellar hook-basal body protein [Enterococcus saccharolyticus]
MNLNSLLHVSRSGVNGMQKKMDVTSNNIANVNTTGYKEKQVSFRELLNNPTTNNDAPLAANAQVALSRGTGADEQSVNFSQGSYLQTNSPYDFAIQGAGFFGVRDADNQLVLTRDGNFGRDEVGRLVNNRGQAVEMNLTVPYQEWPTGTPVVDTYGNVSIVDGGTTTNVGRLVMYLPENNENLIADGNNQYSVVAGTNLATSDANPELFGDIAQNRLENSNVNLAQSMTDMIATQRAYSLNTRVLQSTDEMLSVVNRFTE